MKLTEYGQLLPAMFLGDWWYKTLKKKFINRVHKDSTEFL